MPSRPLFTFAVIADTHLNPTDDVSSSPWETNAAANDRCRAVVEDLNGSGVDLVVHLGDIVHPIPGDDAYGAAADRSHAILANLRPPLYLVPGNHDVGDKPIPWTPAPVVRPDSVALYRRHFGPDHAVFEHGGATFIILDAQLFNTGLLEATAQERWLSELLADLPTDRRLFVFLHYPPFLTTVDEPSHYDNLDEPGRSWLLRLLDRSGTEAVFAGHVHNFFYDRWHDIEFYVAPSTAFVRHDYAELSHVPPADAEHGRDDVDKLGYLLVEVHADHHVCHLRRTGGLRLAAGEPTRHHVVLRTPHSRERLAPPLALDLRHRWAEITEIPYSGGVDEVGRKRVRNDQVLAALWETGLWNLRIPASDLVDEVASKRVGDLAQLGLRFSVFCWAEDLGALRAGLTRHGSAVRTIELLVSPDRWSQAEAAVAAARGSYDGPISLSVLRTVVPPGARHHVHAINHGFDPWRLADGHDGRWFEAAAELGDAVGFRVAHDAPAIDGILLAGRLARARDVQALVHVRCAQEAPQLAERNEAFVAGRAAEATMAAAWLPDDQVVLDTFMEHDRGYFPRVGLIDRRGNPRLAGRVVKHLGALLPTRAGAGEVRRGPDGLCLTSQTGELIVVPSVTTPPRLPSPAGRGHEKGVGTQVDLDDGSVTPFAWQRVGDDLEPVGLGTFTGPRAFLPDVPVEGLAERPGLYQRRAPTRE